MTDAPAAPLRRRRGCIVWGTLLVLVVLCAVGGAFAYWVWRLYGYTSPEPQPVAVYEPKPGEVEAVGGRIEAFREPQAEGAETPGSRRLELSSDDLNALVVGGPRAERYRGKVFFRIEGETLYADVSLPLSEVKLLGLRLFGDRYLNGTVALKCIDIEDGTSRRRGKVGPARRILSVDSIVAGGRALPETYVSHLRQRDILESLADSGWKPYLEGIRDVRIRDGRLIFER